MSKLGSRIPRNMFILNMYKVQDNGDACTHLTTAVAGADCADENVLAVALFEGEGTAAVALKSYFLRLLSKDRQTHPCLTRVPAQRAASTDLAILPSPH